MSFNIWVGFLAAAIMIAVSPGPGAVISMSSAARHGFGAALVAILGLQAAILAHLAIVAIGFGALLIASETAFSLVKLIGASYLIWLGIQKWRAPVVVERALPLTGTKNLFVQGLLVNLTNPKAIIFIGALVPQFVVLNQPLLQQYLIIAATLCITDIVVMSGYALLARRLNKWLHDPHKIRVQNRVFGGLFISAGALLAVSARPS